MVANKLINQALSAAGDRKIADIQAGLSYTAVMLEDEACGLAYAFRNELGCFCGLVGEAGSLIGRKASEVIPWLESQNLLKASMGLAAVNAVLNRSCDDWEEGNVTKALEVVPTDTFGMVGDIGPVLNAVKKQTDNLYVFEQQTEKAPGLYAEADIPVHLPKCSVVVITATSIINQTIDGVLAHCTGAREVCLVGPSCPMSPQVFGEYNVTMLAGDVVTSPQDILQIVSQGGGTRAMKRAMKHVLARVPR
jgi:uncharacterized protein (DUF4213/DUF364 family)